MKQLKVILMGTTDFAVPALEKLVEAGHDVLAVVAQPDRPNQRGKKIKFLPVKQKALELGIPVLQPEQIKAPETVEQLKSYHADVFVVAAYGQLLNEAILFMPPMGSVNIHGSLLPEYRGAAPVHHAIIDGKKEAGVTIMKMDIGMDTGDMLSKVTVPVTDQTTVGELHDLLAEKGAEVLITTLEALSNNSIQGIKQDDSQATYADKINKETGHINWNKTSFEIIRLINGTDPFPAAWTELDDMKIKCFSPVRSTLKKEAEPGTVLTADIKNGLIVKTGDGAVEIREIQVPGKRRMAVSDYLKGNQIETGSVFISKN